MSQKLAAAMQRLKTAYDEVDAIVEDGKLAPDHHAAVLHLLLRLMEYFTAEAGGAALDHPFFQRAAAPVPSPEVTAGEAEAEKQQTVDAQSIIRLEVAGFIQKGACWFVHEDGLSAISTEQHNPGKKWSTYHQEDGIWKRNAQEHDDAEHAIYAAYGTPDSAKAQTHMVAVNFARIVRSWATTEEMEEINRRNQAYRACGSDSCATHEFFDANEAMIEAFRQVFGRDIAFDGSAQQGDFDLACEAWTAASVSGFTIGQ